MAAPSPDSPELKADAKAPQEQGAHYRSLYRRYRPQRFGEVRGQDLTTTTLKNAVRDGRIVHAYLFSGPRGTGKTTTARILAKALNCLQPEEGEPCGRCESCVDIARGSSLDVHELDAASNNGVDAMRDLVARASLATPGKRKVYIIDEVHMLSTAASNALLKTLEEPPEHVVFVLATTDPQKILPTIRSRTQHFEFHLLEPAVLEKLLSDVAADADLELPPDGLEAAVRRGRGSARDALSVLDQVVTSGVVEDDGRFLLRLIEAIAEEDPAGVLRTIGDAVTAGFEAQRLAAELVETLREQFLTSVARKVVRPDSASLGPDGRALLPPARCVHALELIGESIVNMRDSIDPRTTLEVALVRLTNPAVDDSTAALLDRVERLERRVGELESSSPTESAAPLPPAPPPPAPGSSTERGAKPSIGAFLQNGPPPRAPEPAEPERAPAPSAEVAEAGEPPDRDDLVTAWGDSILQKLKPRTKAIYQPGRWLSAAEGSAVFALPNEAHLQHATALRGEVSDAIAAHFGGRIRLELVTETGTSTGSARRPGPRPEEAPVDEPPAGELPPEGELEPGTDAGPGDTASWAEDRLRQAFPGAEEVTR